MTYAIELASEKAIDQNYLMILQPRRRIEGFTLFDAPNFVYSVSYDLGDIASIEEDGVTLTEVSTTALSAGEWYHDTATDTLYVRTSQSADPDTVQLVVIYKMYCATFDAYWHSDPLDDTTEVVYWEPIIRKSLEIKSSTSDSLFGALPINSSGLTLLNTDHLFERHVYHSSFNKASVMIYHWLSDLTVANLKLVYNGLMTNVTYNTDEVVIKTFDRIDELSEEYRNADESFFNTTTFPNCDPNMVGKPIRYVYGKVDGFLPVNVDYVSSAPTTSDNRDWAVVGEQTGLTEISRTVGIGSTATQTNVNFLEGISVGDTIWFDRVAGTDNYAEVLTISYSPSPYITHSILPDGAMASGDHIKKGFVSRVDIVQSGVNYTALYGRDYTVSTALAGGCSGFTFAAGMEAALSLPATLSPNDTVSCSVYGRINNLTAAGPAFGSNDLVINNITNPVMVIYDLLKTRLGLPESRINLTQFATVRTATATEALGFAIPEDRTGSHPTYKDLIIKILQSSLFRIFIDNDLKWTLERLAPLSTADLTMTAADDILDNSFQYEFDYKDIVSDITVEYGRRERSSDPAITTPIVNSVTATSNFAKHHHKVEKSKTFKSLHFRSTDAQTLADRLSFALGDRIGSLSFETKNRFFDSLLNDNVSVVREKMPGFSYTEGTTRTRNAAIVKTTKNLKKVVVELDDQKGVEDNSASW